MKRVNSFLVSFALIAALCEPSQAFAQGDDFFTGRWYTALNVGEEHLEFWQGSNGENVVGIWLPKQEGATFSTYYCGYFSLSGNTITIDCRQSNQSAPVTPFTLKATVNTAKTDITLVEPVKGKTYVFKKEGALDPIDLPVRQDLERRLKERPSNNMPVPQLKSKQPVVNPSVPRAR